MTNLKVANGELLLLDGEIQKRPFAIRVTDIALSADSLSFPPEGRYSTYELSGHVPGIESTGVLTSSGRTALKTLDTNGKVSLSDLELTTLKPYIVKQGNVDIFRGFLDLSMDLSLKNKTIYSPAHAVIKDLVFVHGRGLKDEFPGIPRSQVVKALETSNHRIGFDFILEGSIEDPQSNFRGSMVKRFTVGLAKSLGLSFIEAGETVIILGGRAIWDIQKDVQKLFKSYSRLDPKPIPQMRRGVPLYPLLPLPGEVVYEKGGGQHIQRDFNEPTMPSGERLLPLIYHPLTKRSNRHEKDREFYSLFCDSDADRYLCRLCLDTQTGKYGGIR